MKKYLIFVVLVSSLVAETSFGNDGPGRNDMGANLRYTKDECNKEKSTLSAEYMATLDHDNRMRSFIDSVAEKLVPFLQEGANQMIARGWSRDSIDDVERKLADRPIPAKTWLPRAPDSNEEARFKSDSAQIWSKINDQLQVMVYCPAGSAVIKTFFSYNKFKCKGSDLPALRVSVYPVTRDGEATHPPFVNEYQTRNLYIHIRVESSNFEVLDSSFVYSAINLDDNYWNSKPKELAEMISSDLTSTLPLYEGVVESKMAYSESEYLSKNLLSEHPECN